MIQDLRSAGRNENRIGMAGIAVAKRARIAVENAAEKRHELVCSDAFAQHAVYDPAHPRRTIQFAYRCAQAGLDISHKQSGGNSLARDIRNTDGQPVAVELQHIEVISAHRLCRAPGGGYRDSGKLRNFLGQKRLLDFAGTLQFLLVDFQAGRARLDYALQFDVAALKARLRLAVEKIRHSVNEGDKEGQLPAGEKQVSKRLRTRWGKTPDNYGAQRVNGKHHDA